MRREEGRYSHRRDGFQARFATWSVAGASRRRSLRCERSALETPRGRDVTQILAGLLYLGAGVGLSLYRAIHPSTVEARLRRADAGALPDLGLVVAGDVIYNGAHMYLAESLLVGGLGPWRRAIDQVEALRPRHIVAGHQNGQLDDDAKRT